MLSSPLGIRNTCLNALTSPGVTKPSALAILAPRAITAIVNAIERSGGALSLSKTLDKLSPFARASIALIIRAQIDIGMS